MSTVLFSKTFIAKITSIVRKFWWAGVQDENSTTSFHFRSWEDICQSKDNGGLGIRDLLAVNRSLILHAAWNIATDKDPFLTAILKSKYFPSTSFWLSTNTNTKFVFWASILQIKQILNNHCTIQIHRGNSSIWSTPWCTLWNSIHSHMNLPVTRTSLPQSVADLWVPQTQSWNIDVISEIFDNQATLTIAQTPTVPSDRSDTVRWRPAKNGVCTTKEAFKLLNTELQVQLPQQGTRSISQQAMSILNRTWKHRHIPPCIKTFRWRLIRRALATGERAGSLLTKISKQCATCNMSENDAHIFFHCTYARAVFKSPFVYFYVAS